MTYLNWLSLKSVPGIGNLLFKRLIDRFGDPAHVLQAGEPELVSVSGISPRLARAIRSAAAPADLIRDMETAKDHGCRILTMNDPEYPALLKEIPDPPPYLFVRGRIPAAPVLAVVGSRNASAYGLKNAHRLSRELASIGMTVVSGLARGIDTAAHHGALDGSGPTVAVLGSGLGSIYPPENRELALRIAQTGALVSEFPFFTPPEARNFPIRNRLISGMSLGTLVVEAAMKSGSLITARLALEQNREVFAIPGSIRSFKSSGTHSLLKQGARLVESIQDILEELPVSPLLPVPERDGEAADPQGPSGLKNKFRLDLNEMSVLKVLDSYPVHIDDILEKVPLEPGLLSGILLKLELQGIIIQSPGKLFSINEDVF